MGLLSTVLNSAWVSTDATTASMWADWKVEMTFASWVLKMDMEGASFAVALAERATS